MPQSIILSAAYYLIHRMQLNQSSFNLDCPIKSGNDIKSTPPAAASPVFPETFVLILSNINGINSAKSDCYNFVKIINIAFFAQVFIVICPNL